MRITHRIRWKFTLMIGINNITKIYKMARRRFNKNQKLQILEKYEDGIPIQSIIEEYHISQATFYNWRAKYSNADSSDPHELKMLKEDNERLKRMFADISLENMKLKIQLQNLQKHH